MRPKDMIEVPTAQRTMWTLSADRRTIRLTLPPVPMAGLPRPLKVNLHFDTRTIDEMLEHTSVVGAPPRQEALGPVPPVRAPLSGVTCAPVRNTHNTHCH